jgi:DNA repair exonuclease SbcCD ATPase subunit
MDTLTTRNAPPPLHKFRPLNTWEMHKDNQALFNNERRAVKMEKRELKSAESEYQQIHDALRIANVYEHQAEFSKLVEELNSLKIDFYNLKTEYDKTKDSQKRTELLAARDVVIANRKSISADKKRLNQLLQPYRKQLQRANRRQ